MARDAFRFVESVCDEQTFIEFVAALADDRRRSVAREKISPSSPYGPEANGWENVTIESFFEAAVMWAEASINGTSTYRKSDNPWRRCAEILYMGKIYE